MESRFSPSERRLNIGCGEDKKAGYINIDWQASVQPDVLHDLNLLPYPFENTSFDYIEMSHILEHLNRPFEIMREVHRILKPGGLLVIRVPHFSRGFTHAEHAHGFDITFPYYFNKHFTKSGYIGVDFDLEHMELRWMAFFHLLPYLHISPPVVWLLKGLNTLISTLANISPTGCSRLWCFWVGGFEEIQFNFRKPNELTSS